MFISRKKYQMILDALKNKDERIQNLFTHIIELNDRVKELEKEVKSKPNYFG